MRALHSLFDIDFTLNPRQTIFHLMDAISEIYDQTYVIRREIIMQIEDQRFDNQIDLIRKFMQITIFEQENLHDYKATESFLRFLCKIFKTTHP